jgi:hypothetical protein
VLEAPPGRLKRSVIMRCEALWSVDIWQCVNFDTARGAEWSGSRNYLLLWDGRDESLDWEIRWATRSGDIPTTDNPDDWLPVEWRSPSVLTVQALVIDGPRRRRRSMPAKACACTQPDTAIP